MKDWLADLSSDLLINRLIDSFIVTLSDFIFAEVIEEVSETPSPHINGSLPLANPHTSAHTAGSNHNSIFSPGEFYLSISTCTWYLLFHQVKQFPLHGRHHSPENIEFSCVLGVN